MSKKIFRGGYRLPEKTLKLSEKYAIAYKNKITVK